MGMGSGRGHASGMRVEGYAPSVYSEIWLHGPLQTWQGHSAAIPVGRPSTKQGVEPEVASRISLCRVPGDRLIYGCCVSLQLLGRIDAS
eukprot:9866532-Prorocentrum_lima.AAC.1